MFFSNEDYLCYLSLWQEFAGRYNVRLRGYCLLPNHVHLVPVPSSADTLGHVVGIVHQHYSQLLNLREKSSGHRCQNRFFSCPLERDYLAPVLRYVECNATRANLVSNPWDYQWSSAQAHITGVDSTGLLDLSGWDASWPGDSWREYISQPAPADEIEAIRRATRVGRPLASEEVLDILEIAAGRSLRPRSVGRPRIHPAKSGKI